MSDSETNESAGRPDAKPADLNPVFGIAAAVLIIVSIAFRFWKLSNIPGLNGDEAEYGANCLALLHHQPMDWYTQNGNFRNPFYYIPLFALQSFLPPSIELLRITAAAYGVFALWLNWRLCGRVFGPRTAVATTLVLAVLPEDIAQSRLGWDPSQSVLIDVVVFYLALMLPQSEKRAGWITAGLAIACLVAIAVHPSNLFMGLIALPALGIRWKDELRPWFDPRVRGMKWLFGYLAAIVGATAVVGWKWSWISSGLESTLQTNSAQVFPIFYARLLDGTTVLRYVAGSLMPGSASSGLVWAMTIATFVVFAPVVILAARALFSATMNPADRLVGIGWLIVFAAFLVIGGAQSLLPGNERDGLVLIVPSVAALVRSWESLVETNGWMRIPAGAGISIVGALLLGLFYTDYFQFIETTGGLSEQTYRTAAVEPKLQAWRIIEADTTDTHDVTIVVTSTWWNYQPLRYFAANDATMWVLENTQTENSVQRAQVSATAAAGRLWFVEFAHSRKIEDIKQQLESSHSSYTEKLVDDYAGKPVLDIVHVTGGQAPAIL
jgi:hypothetical protein